MGGALLAVVPLWTGAWALLQLALYREAHLRVLPVACGPESLSIAATNIGGRPAMVEGSDLEVVADGELLANRLPLVPREENSVLQPNDTRIYSLAPVISGIPTMIPRPVSSQSCIYRILIRVKDFEDRSDLIQLTCPCPRAG
jgi:hypothetical protein